MQNQNLNILDEVNKGATMGMDALSIIYDKASDNEFKKVLDTEFNKYKKISERVNVLYDNYTRLGVNKVFDNLTKGKCYDGKVITF